MWQPDETNLVQLVDCLKQADNPDPQVQQSLFQQLESFNQVADYNNYLMYIFARLEGDPVTQQSAGLLLKNNALNRWHSFNDSTIAYIKTEVLPLVNNPNKQIQTTVGVIMSAILRAAGIGAWPQLIPHLLELLNSNDETTIISALTAIYIICEDCAPQLNAEEFGRPVNEILPRLFPFLTAPHRRMRQLSLTCISFFIVDAPLSLVANLDTYLKGLFQLTSDDHPRVLLLVCEAFCKLSEIFIDQLVPHMDGIIQFILHCMSNDDDDIKLAATDFWSAIARTRGCRQLVEPHIDTLFPLLLQGMVYSDAELAALLNSQDDASVPDDPRDVKPRFANAKQKGVGGDAANDDLDSDDDEEEELEDGEIVMRWTVRKSSARGLDRLCRHFPQRALTLLMPYLTAALQQTQDWRQMEAAILAVGAIADGCFMVIADSLPELIPFLLQCADSPQVLVKTITAWTLSRYSKWVVMQPDHKTYFEPMLFALMLMCTSTSKMVQEAGISALATFEDVACFDLIAYLEPLCRCLMHCLTNFQQRNRFVCYDAIATLAIRLGDELNSPAVVNMLLPPLIEKWRSLPNDSDELYGLFECLTAVSLALGDGLGEFAAPMTRRAIELAQAVVVQVHEFEQHRQECIKQRRPVELDEPQVGPLVASLDLISGVIEGFGETSPALIDDSIGQLVLACVSTPLFDVRQSAFAVAGDLAVNAPTLIAPHLEELVPALLHNIRPFYIGLSNNVVWTLGELALLLKEQFRDVVPPLLERLLPMMQDEQLHPHLLHNVCVCLGRVAIHHSDQLTPHINSFIKQWCAFVRCMTTDSEKHSAIEGMCALCETAPREIMPHFIFIVDVIASYHGAPPKMKERLHSLLFAYKDAFGEHWNAFYARVPRDVTHVLEQEYFGGSA